MDSLAFFRKKKTELKNTKQKKTISQMRREGLYGTLRDLISFTITDNILKYSYKYERIDFYRSIMNRTMKGMYKITFKIIHTQFDYVYNDLKATYFNGLKIIATQNTRLYHMFETINTAKPLSRLARYGKFTPGYFPKVKEFYNFTGAYNNYHVIQFFVNKVKNMLYSSDAFRYLGDLLSDIIKLFIKVKIKIIKLKKAFIRFRRYSKKVKFILFGMCFKARKKRLNYFRRRHLTKDKTQKENFKAFTRIKKHKRKKAYFLKKLFLCYKLTKNFRRPYSRLRRIVMKRYLKNKVSMLVKKTQKTTKVKLKLKDNFKINYTALSKKKKILKSTLSKTSIKKRKITLIKNKKNIKKNYFNGKKY